MQPSETLSAREAALEYHLNDRTLRRAIERGDLKATKGPTRNSPMRIDRDDMNAYAAKMGLSIDSAPPAAPVEVNGVVAPESEPEAPQAGGETSHQVVNQQPRRQQRPAMRTAPAASARAQAASDYGDPRELIGELRTEVRTMRETVRRLLTLEPNAAVAALRTLFDVEEK